MISQALLVGDISHAVDLCISRNLMSEAIITAKFGSEELCYKTHKLCFYNSYSDFTKVSFNS